MFFYDYRSVYLLFLCLLCGTTITSSLTGQQISVREIAVKRDGLELPGNPVISLLEDSDGFIWAAFSGPGIGRYDGRSLKRFTEAEGAAGAVWSMVEDQKGYLWLGGRPVNGSPGKVVVSSAPITGGLLASDFHFRDSVGTTALSKGFVQSVQLDSYGQIWATTDSVLNVYAWQEDGVLSSTTVAQRGQGRFQGRLVSALPLPDGTVWLSFDGNINVIYQLRVDPGTAQVQVLDSIALPHAVTVELRMTDGQGRLWGNFMNTDYYRIDPASREVKAFPSGVRVFNMRSYDKKNIVVSTSNRGMLFLDKENGRETASFGMQEGLPSAAVFDVVLSKRGDLWVAGMRGLSHLPADFTAFTAYTDDTRGTLPPLLSEPSVNNVTAGIWLLQPDGSRDTVTLVGTMSGLLILPESSPPYVVTASEGLPVDIVMGAVQDNEGGIYLTSPRTGIWYVHPPGVDHPHAVKSVALDGLAPGYRADKVGFWPLLVPQLLRLPGSTKEVLWGAQDDRVMCRAGAKGVRIYGPDTGFRGVGIGTLHQYADGLLHVVNTDGWFRSLQAVTQERLDAITVSANLTSDGNHYLVESAFFQQVPIIFQGDTVRGPASTLFLDNELWLAVDSVLLIVDPVSGVTMRSFSFGGEVTSVTALADGGSVVWAGTADAGLYAIRKNDLTLTQRVLRQDGLLSSFNWSPNGLAVNKRGEVIQATSEGLQLLRPQLNQPDTFARSIYLTELNFITDNWGSNELNVSYVLLSYRDEPGEVWYQTRLVGEQDDWSTPSTEGKLRYTNLSAFFLPRTYEMEVRATDYRGNVFQTKAGVYPLVVQAPYYLRWWAILIYLALLALAVRALLRYQLRQQEKELKLKEAVVIRQQRDEITAKNAENEVLLKEIHHRVKNNLEVVSSLLELQSVTLTDQDARDAMLAGRSRVSTMGILHQKLYQGDNLGYVSMHEHLSDLTRNLGHTFGVSDRVTFTVAVPKDLRLDVDTAVPVGLIANELITNSVKYAFEGGAAGDALSLSNCAIKVEMSRVGEHHLLTVSDNGSGKTEGAVGGTGFGTRLVGMLVQQLEGELLETNDGGLRTEVAFGGVPL